MDSERRCKSPRKDLSSDSRLNQPHSLCETGEIMGPGWGNRVLPIQDVAGPRISYSLCTQEEPYGILSFP